MEIEPNMRGKEFKEKVAQEYNKKVGEEGEKLSPDQIRMRNPRLEDLGEVIADNDIMENFYLYDGKEFLLQVLDPERNFEFVTNPNNAYHILIREWNPQTWELGPLKEVKVEKSCYATKFHTFLCEKVFPHIPSDCLVYAKVNFLKNFKRGDLYLKRWNTIKY